MLLFSVRILLCNKSKNLESEDLNSTMFSVCSVPAKLHQSCPTLWDPVDCRPPGFSVQGILQQEYWSGLPCRGSSLPRDQAHISYVSYVGRQVLYHWAIREALNLGRANIKIELVELFMRVAGIFVNCLGLHYIIWDLKFCFIWCLSFFTEYIIYPTCSN